MNRIQLANNIPNEEAILFLEQKEDTDSNRELIEKAVSGVNLPQIQKSMIWNIWLRYSEKRDRVSALEFVREIISLSFVKISPWIANETMGIYFLWDIRQIPQTYHESAEPPRKVFYQMFCALLSALAENQILEIILIELPDKNFLDTISGDKFINEISQINNNFQTDQMITLLQLLAEMEMVIETMEQRLHNVAELYEIISQLYQEENMRR